MSNPGYIYIDPGNTDQVPVYLITASGGGATATTPSVNQLLTMGVGI